MGGNTASKHEAKYPQDKLVEKQEDERFLAQAARRTISSLTRQNLHTDSMAAASTNGDSNVTHGHDTESQTPSNPTPSQAEDSDSSSAQAVLQTKDQPSPECDLHHHDKDATLSNVRACEDTSTSTNSDNESMKPPSPKKIKLSLSLQATNKSSQPHVAAAFSDSTRIYCENDVCHLVEALVDHASKWKEIGLMLGFTPSKINTIESKPLLMQNAPNSYLMEMLSMWVQRTAETHRPTLANLKKALQSKTVGLAALAEEIEMNVYCSMKSDEVVYDVHLDDTFNTLTTTPDIPKSPLDHFADYLRCYYTSSSEQPKWPELEPKDFIRLTVVSNEHKTHSTEFEELQKIKLCGSIDDIVKTKLPIEFSDLLKPNDIKDKMYQIRRMLIEGAPGIGKSTMSWQICQKWGNGELFQDYSLVLLLRFRDPWVHKMKCVAELFSHGNHCKQHEISAKIQENQGDKLLLVLEGFDEAPPELRKDDSLFLQLFKGSLLPKATVIVTTRPNESNILRKICKGNLSRRIEVLGFGFGKKEISKYILAHMDDENLRKKFHQYLDMYPHIHNMMYVPLNCAIITHIYTESSYASSSNAIIPKTMTQLYISLVKTLLLRYMKEIPEYRDNQILADDFSDLPKPVLEKFEHLCELAASGRVVFSDLPKDFDSLGLMQSYPELYIDKGASVSYSFLHLTLQEFLRAFYFKPLITNTDAYMLLHNYNCNPKFLAGLIKLPLFIKLDSERRIFDETDYFSDHSIRRFIIAPSKKKSRKCRVYMEDLHLLFEAQDPEVFRVYKDFDLYSVSANSSAPFDFYVLGYCIAVSNVRWNIKDCTGDPNHIEMMIKGMSSSVSSSNNSSIKSISFDSDFNDECMKQLFANHSLTSTLDCYSIVKDTKYIYLSKDVPCINSLTHIGCKYLADIFPKLDSLCELYLDNNKSIGDGGAVQLFQYLPGSVTCLGMSYTGIGEEDCKALKDRLTESSSRINIKILDISFNFLSPKSVRYVMEGLSFCTSLEELIMHFSSFDPDTCKLLLPVLRNNKSMFTLHLGSCNIDGKSVALFASELVNFINFCLDTCENDLTEYVKFHEAKRVQTAKLNVVGVEGALALGNVLSNQACSISCLNLNECALGEEGIANLSQGLTNNSGLTELDLNKNHICSTGASHLAKALESNLKTNLTHLYLVGNSIQSDGAFHLAQVLKINISLMELDLTSNAIKNEGVQYIIRGIYANKKSSLKVLELSNNQIDCQGAIVFVDIEPAMILSLKNVNLRFNPILPETVQKIIQSHKKFGGFFYIDADTENTVDYEHLSPSASLQELNDLSQVKQYTSWETVFSDSWCYDSDIDWTAYDDTVTSFDSDSENDN